MNSFYEEKFAQYAEVLYMLASTRMLVLSQYLNINDVFNVLSKNL